MASFIVTQTSVALDRFIPRCDGHVFFAAKPCPASGAAVKMSPYVARCEVWPGLRTTLLIALVGQIAMVPMLWYSGSGLGIPLVGFVISAGLAGHAAGYSPALAPVIGVLLSPPWGWAFKEGWELDSPFGQFFLVLLVVGIIAGALFGTLVGYAQRWED